MHLRAGPTTWLTKETPAAERRAELDAWQRRLHAAVESAMPVVPGFSRTDGTASVDDLMLLATAHSIRTLDLPLSLFDDLVSAFAQDTMTTRYASWTDVLDYCRRSPIC